MGQGFVAEHSFNPKTQALFLIGPSNEITISSSLTLLRVSVSK
jgi:hypothetical protein